MAVPSKSHSSCSSLFCSSDDRDEPFEDGHIPVLIDTLEDPQIDSQNDDEDDNKPNNIIEKESFHIYHLEIPNIEPSEETEQSHDHAEETTEPSDEPSEENRVEDFSVIQSNVYVNVNPMSIQ